MVETTLSPPFAPDAEYFAGLARMSDLTTPLWGETFRRCEQFSNRFLEASAEWSSPDYPWRIDPLHCWSRLWEYPFALAAIEGRSVDGPTRIVDVGAGANFFGLLLAHLGYSIEAVDGDNAVVAAGRRLADFARARLGVAAGSLSFLHGDARELPVPDASADVVQCISVIEHVPEAQEIVPELARVLRPGGTLVLTFDLALAGQDGLDVDALQNVLHAVGRYFEITTPEARTVFEETRHLSDILTNFTSPADIRSRERLGPRHCIREVEHWPPLQADWWRPISTRRALAAATARKQPLLALYAVKARKRRTPLS